jgi:uncharacterized DUF497 family protein
MMGIHFDPAKAASNLQKHGVHFSEAEMVLQDQLALTIEDPDAAGEQRWITMGTDSMGRILLVVYTYRSDQIRVISVRKASRQEREKYHAQIL